MTEVEFFKIISLESDIVIKQILKRQDVFTLQKLKRKFEYYWVKDDIIDAINYKLSGI